MANRKNILIVDKDNVFLHTLKNEFAEFIDSYQIAFATSSAKVLTIMGKFVVNLIAVSINLSGESGIDLLALVRHNYPNVHVVLYTDEEIHEEYKRTLLYGGAAAVLQKPFHAQELVKITANLCRKNDSKILPDFVKLPDLLQMIAGEKNSVRLEITDPVSQMAGIIIVQNGYLTKAITTNGRKGVGALMQMLVWGEPAIVANKLPPQVDTPALSGIPLGQAVLQAVIRLDETGV